MSASHDRAHSPWGSGSFFWVQIKRIVEQHGDARDQEQARQDFVQDPKRRHGSSKHAVGRLDDVLLETVQVPRKVPC